MRILASTTAGTGHLRPLLPDAAAGAARRCPIPHTAGPAVPAHHASCGVSQSGDHGREGAVARHVFTDVSRSDAVVV